MGKLKTFVIVFDQNKDVYLPGEIVSGKVIAEVYDGIKARGVRVNFHGFAYLHWTESRTTGSGENQQTVTEHYSALETYFDKTVTVWGKEIGDKAGDSPIFPPGYHEFPFRHQLGTNLPSSFEGGIGYVRYSIKGIIDRPWRFDHTTKCAFTVLDMYDLNLEPNAQSPSGNQNSKTLCCLCCKSGPIELQAQTDRGGYCPGERVVVRGSVENNSNTLIYKTSAKLVRVTAHIKGPHLNLKVALPIIIGSIPLRSLYGGVPQMGAPTVHGIPDYSMTGGDPTAPATPDYFGATAPVPDYSMATAPLPNPPLPSYAEATGGAANIRDSRDNDYTMGQLTFAPKYMYYDWSQHPQP